MTMSQHPAPIEKQVQDLTDAGLSIRKIAQLLPVSASTVQRIRKKNETGPNRVLRARTYRLRGLARSRGLAAAALLALAVAAIAAALLLYRTLIPPAVIRPAPVTVCVHRGPDGNINGLASYPGGCPARWNTVTLTSGPVSGG